MIVSSRRMWLVLLAISSVFASGTVASESRESVLKEDGWIVAQDLPGSDACVARREGGEVDTMLMLNQKGDLLFVAGRKDWEHLTANKEIALQIDGLKIDHLIAIFYTNLVFLRIIDESIVRRLRSATTVVWNLPTGKYRAVVTGLGAAMDSLRDCALRAPAR